MTRPALDRFNEKWVLDVESGCHLWTANKVPGGYGRFWTGTKQDYAHRFILEQKLGRPIDEGKRALRMCDTPSCVNREHLFEGTAKDNSQDMAIKGRTRGGFPPRQTCKRGHIIADVGRTRARAYRGCLKGDG